MMVLSRWIRSLFQEFSSPQSCSLGDDRPIVIRQRLDRYTSY